MQKNSRVWFDSVYNFIEGWLPICIMTGRVDRKGLIRITRGILSSGEISRLQSIASQYYKSLPSEEDFREEKERIYLQLREDLCSLIPYVETIVSFGSIVGDIDLGIISESPITDEQLSLSFKKEIAKKYPLVDWDTLWFFKSTSGYDLAEKIILSREMCLRTNELPLHEREYIRRNIASSEILYGSGGRLFEMKEEFFHRFIFQEYLRKTG